MRNKKNNGFSLIEMIASVAILSIVGIAAFTLLIFCIRTNSFIVSGSTAVADSNLLNKRLEQIFERATDADLDENGNIIFFNAEETSDVEETSGGETPVGDCLSFENNTIRWNGQSLAEEIENYEVVQITGSNLFRISYTIDGEYDCVKIFKVGK